MGGRYGCATPTAKTTTGARYSPSEVVGTKSWAPPLPSPASGGGNYLCRFPATAKAYADPGALRKGLEPFLHLRPGGKVGCPVHQCRHHRPIRCLIRQQAVPIEPLIGALVPLDTGEGLGPAQHPLEDGPAAEHPARRGVIGDDRVVDTQAAQRVAQLQSTGPAAHDDQSIAAWRKRLLR